MGSMLSWDEPRIANNLRGVDARIVERLRAMNPRQLRRFACDAAALALARAGLTEPRITAALEVARLMGTGAEPPAASLAALRADVERLFNALDLKGFQTLEAHEAGRGPSYEDYLAATHRACAAESVLYALRDDPRLAAVTALSVAEWTTPPRVEVEDFVEAADGALRSD